SAPEPRLYHAFFVIINQFHRHPDRLITLVESQALIQHRYDLIEGSKQHQSFGKCGDPRKPPEIAGIFSAHRIHALPLSFPGNGTSQMILAYAYPFRYCRRRNRFAGFHKLFYFPEYPGMTDGRTTNHNAVNAVPVFVVKRFLRTVDVAIAENGDMYARIVFHLPDQLPVGDTFIHLAAGTAVNGKR